MYKVFIFKKIAHPFFTYIVMFMIEHYNEFTVEQRQTIWQLCFKKIELIIYYFARLIDAYVLEPIIINKVSFEYTESPFINRNVLDMEYTPSRRKYEIRVLTKSKERRPHTIISHFKIND